MKKFTPEEMQKFKDYFMDDKCQIPMPKEFEGYANVEQAIIQLIEENTQLKEENERLRLVFEYLYLIQNCESCPCSIGPATCYRIDGKSCKDTLLEWIEGKYDM